MSLLLVDSPVKAAVSPHLFVNILSRRRATLHDINNALSVAQLPVTARFLGQGRSIVLPFIISDEDLEFEIVLGSQWELRCTQYKVPCPLTTVDVPPDTFPRPLAKISYATCSSLDMSLEFEHHYFIAPWNTRVKSAPCMVWTSPAARK